MAIVIGEVQVEVAPTPAPQKSGSQPSESKEHKLELAAALEMLRERKARLKAD